MTQAAPALTQLDRIFCGILSRELVCALGCTEPIAVAYAAALARETLGDEPTSLEVACSGNIIKNVKSVTVPNSGGMTGIEAAATLGAVDGNAESSLEVLESVTTEHLAHAQVGQTLMQANGTTTATRARARAAAGSDARMNGCATPVVIVCGSGNQGITTCLPVVEYAKKLGESHDRPLCAVALSDLTAIHVKRHIGALSAFCGVVCAACGAGAAITWMSGGTPEQVGATIVNTLGNVGGIVCDGAKASCAAKISAAVDAAVLGHQMAMAGRGFHAGESLVQGTVKDTIASMGYVGRVGMAATDVKILNIMIGKTDVTC